MTKQVYKTAQGKALDMGSLILQHENVRAVGNMNVNARGDVLDSNNKIIRDNTQRVKESYKNTVRNQSGMMPTPDDETPIPPPPMAHKVTVVEELSPEEQLFEDEDEDIQK